MSTVGHLLDSMPFFRLWQVLRLIRNCIQHEFEAVFFADYDSTWYNGNS